MNQFDTLFNQILGEAKKMKNPCWGTHKPIGTKIKDGETVPHCVPKNPKKKKVKESIDVMVQEATRCTKSTKKASSTRKDKKWMKCVKSGSGYKRIHWGQKGVRVTGKSGNTKRKKSFRARHKCSTAKPGTPRYQACKDW